MCVCVDLSAFEGNALIGVQHNELYVEVWGANRLPNPTCVIWLAASECLTHHRFALTILGALRCIKKRARGASLTWSDAFGF